MNTEAQALADEIVRAIHDDLSSRSGMLEDIDDEVMQEIIAAHKAIVLDRLAAMAQPKPHEGHSASASNGSPGGAWQPIETAQQDGSQVLLRVRPRFNKLAYGAVVGHGYWARDFWVIFNADTAVQRVEATHWMPLPAAPTPGKGEHG